MAEKLKEILSTEKYNALVDEIKEYIGNGWSKNKTFTYLGISKNNLDTILKDEGIIPNNKKDIQNSISNHKTLEEREKGFAKTLNKKDNTKIYISGYICADSMVTIKCLKCNTIYNYSATNLRHRNKIFCKTCEQKQKEQIKRQRHEEKAKERKDKRLLVELEKALNSEQISMCVCKQCGGIVIGNKNFCSVSCYKKYDSKKREIRRRIKIQDNGNADYTISLERLIKRDNNICYLCGQKCNLEDYTYRGNTFIAGNYYPSIEHVIPLSKGGTHTWNNVKLAHRICNSMKGNK